MDKYIIFGTGVIGKKVFSLLNNRSVFCFCDNNQHSENDRLFDKPVYFAGNLKKIYVPQKHIVVVASTKPLNIVQITRQLDDMRIPFVLFDDIANQVVKDEAKQYQSLNPPESFQYKEDWEYLMPMDRVENAGTVSSYLWQDLWAARHIFRNKPSIHYDIGSRVDGFITHLLSFELHVVQLDIRPFNVSIPNLDFVQTDATNLDGIKNGSLESVSALCSLEHFGLGRYGDLIDPMACFRCFDALQNKMKEGGTLYISVPVGKEHLEYNAHRVFYASTIVSSFSNMDLLEYSSCLNNEIEENIPIDKYDEWDEYGGERFGLFRFRKKIV